MPWINDEYYYTRGILDAIVEWYCLLYDRQLIIGTYQITHLFTLVEFKADFDIALDSIGRGEWRGLEDSRFNAYKYFGKQQQIVIAGILGIQDYELERMGFYGIPRLRGDAYSRILDALNTKVIRVERFSEVSKAKP